MRKQEGQYTVQWITGQGTAGSITARAGANLLEACRQAGIPMEAACNGNGICGKCKVQILQGNVPVTEAQRKVFTPGELAAGYRLACQVKVTQELSIRVQGHKMQIQAPDLGLGTKPAVGMPSGIPENSRAKTGSHPGYSIAADLGTTVLAAVLTDGDGKVLAQASAANSQRSYGADVISRIQASNEGKKKELQACVCRDLEKLFQKLAHTQGQAVPVSRIAIAGNTTMLHLLRGYSCEKLGQAPFEPVSLLTECLDYGELFREAMGFSGSKVYLLPGMSAFVGADITAGLYSSGFWQTPEDELAFFVDLGTNGELAFGNRAGFVAASTAAGPAFEGGSLSCGVPGIAGAISKVSYLYHRVRVQTVGQKKPCGLCGTGALEAVAALLEEGLMDADGLLAPELSEKGMVLAKREDGSEICLTQADIREIQMAKAAIRAGIEILQRRYQEASESPARRPVTRVYLAGGFGYYLSAKTAAAVGLFPAKWKERTAVCGNTSLKGAIAFLADEACAGEMERICKKSRVIRLESDAHFQDIYVRHMGFP